MCVIAICEYARLTDEQVDLMWEANKHGGGVAWRTPVNPEDPESEMVVRWSKGHTKAEMIEFNKNLPLPYVLHFRVPSSGTSTSFLACHPFQIDEFATTHFEGVTSGYVLFHNGFWGDWKNKLQNISIGGYVRIPSGPWSDSRGLAWAAHHLGIGFLDIVDEKVVAFGPGPEDIEVFGVWSQIKNKDEEGKEQQVLVSNKMWERNTAHFPNHGGHGRGQSSPNVTDRRNPNLPLLAAGGDSGSSGQTGGSADSQSFRGSATGAIGTITEGRLVEESVSQAAKEDSGRGSQGREESVVVNSSLKHSCSGCEKKTSSGTLIHGQWFCWQCWAPKIREEGKKPYVGICGVCRTNCCGAKLEAPAINHPAGTWICMACWETNGKPKVVFAYRVAGELQAVEV